MSPSTSKDKMGGVDVDGMVVDTNDRSPMDLRTFVKERWGGDVWRASGGATFAL